MPETVTVNKELNIIEVRSFGSILTEQLARSVAEVKRIHRETSIDKVFVDTHGLTSFPGTIDIFEIAKGFPRGIRIAVLAVAEQEMKGDLQFAQTVAQNRGVLIRLFESKDEAIEWLRV